MDLRNFQRRFGERVRALRLARGLRQEDVEEFGLSWKGLQKVEYGASDPKASTLLKLATAFDVSLGELLRLDDTLPAPTRKRAPRGRPGTRGRRRRGAPRR